MKVLIILVVVALGVVGFGLFKMSGKKEALLGGGGNPIAAPVKSGKSVLAPVAMKAVERAYEIYCEQFRGVCLGGSSAMLHTSGGWYEVGQMSNKGFVTAVSERRAKIAMQDGRTGWVVAEDAAVPVGPSPTPVVSGSTVVAADNGPLYMALSEDQRRRAVYPDLAIKQQDLMRNNSGVDASFGTSPALEKRLSSRGLNR